MVVICIGNVIVDRDHSLQIKLLAIVVDLLVSSGTINLFIVFLNQEGNNIGIVITGDILHTIVRIIDQVRQIARGLVIHSSVVEGNCPGFQSLISIHNTDLEGLESIGQVSLIGILKLDSQIIAISTTTSSRKRHEIVNGISIGIITGGLQGFSMRTESSGIHHTHLFFRCSTFRILTKTTSPILELHSRNIGIGCIIMHRFDLVTDIDIDICTRCIRSTNSLDNGFSETSIKSRICIQQRLTIFGKSASSELLFHHRGPTNDTSEFSVNTTRRLNDKECFRRIVVHYDIFVAVLTIVVNLNFSVREGVSWCSSSDVRNRHR